MLDRWKTFSPPADWQPASSAVEGLAWWAPPTPGATPPAGPPCPRCGARVPAPEDGARAACSFCPWAAPEDSGLPVRAADPITAGRTQIHCGGCGARVALPAGGDGSTCLLCGSSHVSARAAGGPTPIRPAGLVPFSVTAEVCRQHVARWLGGGWFHPWNLSRIARVERLHALYVPHWVFTAAVDAEWKARVGHERVERTFDPRTNSWETRVELDWRWQTGRVRSPARPRIVQGTRRLPHGVVDVDTTSELADAVPFDPALLGTVPVVDADLPLADAWERGRADFLAGVREDCRAALPTQHVRDLTVVADLLDESWQLVLLPVWVAPWWFRDRSHAVSCHGRTGVIAGDKPVDWRKVRAALVVALGPGILLVLVGVPLLFVFAVGVPVMLFGLFLLVLGSVASVLVWSSALASEGG